MAYVLRCNNSEVTEFYLETIKEMLQNCNERIEFQSTLNECICKKELLIVSTVVDFAKAYIRGHRKIIIWMQGIEAEENYLIHGSNMKQLILNLMTRLALNKSIGIFYVSEEMRRYEEKKFKINTLQKSFIMPCFNTFIDTNSFFRIDKYNNNIFTYVGSLSEWQCFRETIEFYKKIEKTIPNAQLRVYTAEQEKAETVLKEAGVVSCMINYVKPEQITKVLSEAKFGFVIRNDIAVNNVATPTKLSSYMAAGVIPIFSGCIHDFYERTKDLKYIVSINENMEIPQKLINLCNSTIMPSDIYAEFRTIFETYYCRDYYILKSDKWIRKILHESK